MRLPALESAIIIIIVSIGTMITRYLPFFVFKSDRQTPAIVQYLGKTLPFATIGMLVIFCLRNVSLRDGAYAIPEFLSILLITGIHLWKRNTLLSISLGVLFYMVLSI